MTWVRRIAIGLSGFILLAVVTVYAGSQWIIRRGHAVPLAAAPHASGPAAIAEGGRIAFILGCRDCHGTNGQGGVLVQSAMIGTIAPPPLARLAADRSDAELARAIRHGMRKDGSSLFIMPANAHRGLAEDDMAMLIAWIRSLKPSAADSTATMRFGPLLRAVILAGKLPPSVQAQAAHPARRPAEPGGYLAGVACLSCHELHRETPTHDGKQIVPALAPIAASYDPDAFRTLLRTGKGMAPRDLGLMRVVAQGGLHALSDTEIGAIQGYLRGEAGGR
jgi:cytochrome c553